MPRALFTKTVTNVYQYEVDVEDVSTYYDERYSNEIVDSFTPSTLVDTKWDIDVEEVNG
jgi:hypothetical protein